jgi:hypothetical protein
MHKPLSRYLVLVYLIAAGLNAGAGSMHAYTYIDLNHRSVAALDVRAEFETLEFQGIAALDARDVSTEDDLRLFEEGLKLSDERVESVNFTGETVEVRYKQQGRFLALVPITFRVQAVAHANGNVEVRYPWYSTLTVDNRSEVEAKAKVAVGTAMYKMKMGSVRAEGKVDNPRFTPSESAIVASELSSVLKASFDSWGQVGDE